MRVDHDRVRPSNRRRIEVLPYDPEWANLFHKEAKIILNALGSTVASIHHIGSTAVPGILAKPIIDVLVEATTLAAMDRGAPNLVAQGYEAMGEHGIPGRRYFRKTDSVGRRAFHVHGFVVGDPAARRHSTFRDYLREHPDVAQAYSTLKRDLAARHPEDPKQYAKGKQGFIEAVLAGRDSGA